MKLPFYLALILMCSFATKRAAIAGEAPVPAPADLEIPAALRPPGDQALALTLTARGVQIYECRAAASDIAKSEWVLKAPEADLFDAQGKKVGRHYGGPTWELSEGDGSKVVGRVKAKADAPDGQSIPWVLLEAAAGSGGGNGVMRRVRSIQRVNTVGGQAPAGTDGVKAGQEARVDYTATYHFFVSKP